MDQNEFLRMIGQADQANETTKLLAKHMSAYFFALAETGLSRDEALALTREYQQMVMTMAFAAHMEKESGI